MKKEKRRSIARSLTRRIVIWLFVLMGLTSFCMCFFTMLALEYFYSFSYHNSMRSTTEYTRRVQSDIYVAVTNNLALIESQIDHPEQLQATMEQIVSTNNRIRSCGISFIDSYYPQYGRWFCPYAWKEDMDGDGIKEVQSNNMAPDTTIFLYTDGLTEAENIEHLQFGEDNAQDVLRQCIAGESLTSKDMVRQMTMAVHAFVGEAEQSDDLTMLAIKRNK